MNTERSTWAARSQELAQLMSRSALGDRAAFARLYDLTSGHLFAVVLRIQRDRALAEDLLQEVYVNLWRSAEQLRRRAVAADDLAHQRGAQQGDRQPAPRAIAAGAAKRASRRR